VVLVKAKECIEHTSGDDAVVTLRILIGEQWRNVRAQADLKVEELSVAPKIEADICAEPRSPGKERGSRFRKNERLVAWAVMERDAERRPDDDICRASCVLPEKERDILVRIEAS